MLPFVHNSLTFNSTYETLFLRKEYFRIYRNYRRNVSSTLYMQVIMIYLVGYIFNFTIVLMLQNHIMVLSV